MIKYMMQDKILRSLAFPALFFLSVCLSPDPARAQNVSAKLRIGLIEPLDASGLPAASIPMLQHHLLDVDASAGFGHSIHLFRCQPEQVDPTAAVLIGATGMLVSLPASWLQDVEFDERGNASQPLPIFHGVVWGNLRPKESGRRQLYSEWQPRFAERTDVPSLHFSPDLVPSDVVLAVRDDGYQLGCDWDGNLRLEKDEIIDVKPGQYQLHATANDTAVVLATMSVPPAGELGDDTAVAKLWTITTETAARNDSLVSTLLGTIEDHDCELVWIDCGSVAYARQQEVFGPADLATALQAARRNQCDLVCVDLQRCYGEPTSVAKMLAELSVELQLPIIVNRKTILSPRYRIDPNRLSVPDIAELLLDDRSKPDHFAAAVDRALVAIGDQSAAQPDASESATTNSDTTIPQAIETIAKMDRLHPLDSPVAPLDGWLIGRVPPRTINMAVGRKPDARLGLVRMQSVRYYDHTGRLISVPRYRSGSSADHLPLFEAARAAGGFVAVRPTELERLVDAASNVLPATFPLEIVQGDRPVIELQAGTDRLQIELQGAIELPDQLSIVGYSSIRKLRPRPAEEVPTAVRRSASPLLERADNVRSFWYRSDAWPGINSGRYLFAESSIDDSVPHSGRFQFWEFTNTGLPPKSSLPLGSVGAAEGEIRWLLVEVVATGDDHRSTEPTLIECLGLSDAVRSQTFDRVSHRAMTDEAGEPYFIDRFESKQPIANERWLRESDAILAGLLLEPHPHGTLVRWLQIKRSDDHLARDDLQRIAQSLPSWWPSYRDDLAVAEVDRRRMIGQSPDAIMKSMAADAHRSPSDLVALRRWLVALDQPSIRKLHLDTIADAADRVIGRCRDELGGLPSPVDPAVIEALHAAGSPGMPEATDEPAAAPFRLRDDPAAQQYYAWAVDALYRRFRALGYKELPEVLAENPILRRDEHDRQLNATFFQLAGMVDINHPDFVLARVRRQRRDGNPQQAYQHLQTYGAVDPDPGWYFKKERDLWDDMDLGLPQRLGHARWFLRDHDVGLR